MTTLEWILFLLFGIPICLIALMFLWGMAWYLFNNEVWPFIAEIVDIVKGR